MLKAIIFDFNGVILRDEKIHQQSWRMITQRHGLELSEAELRAHVFGLTEEEAFEYLFKKSLSPEKVAELSAERVALAKTLLDPEAVVTPGLLSFLPMLAKHQIPMAIATNSRRPYLNFILQTLDITKYFSVIVTAEEVAHGKPDPEMFQMACQRLNVARDQAVIFEDSVTGIKAAKAAGIKVIALTTTHPAEDLGQADLIIPSFSNLSLTAVAAVLD